jgi:5'-deoxynucleotidase YfbR-like HD superfamily hydrolase
MTQRIGVLTVFNDFLKDAGFEAKYAGFATKCENMFTCIQYFRHALGSCRKSLMADYLVIIR